MLLFDDVFDFFFEVGVVKIRSVNGSFGSEDTSGFVDGGFHIVEALSFILGLDMKGIPNVFYFRVVSGHFTRSSIILDPFIISSISG